MRVLEIQQSSGGLFRDTEKPPSAPQSMAELVFSAAKQRPEAVAIEAPGRAPLTYDGLRLLTEQVGGKLGASGIRKSDRVALVLPNGPESAAAFVAVSAFATCAPLNPAYQSDEFAFYLSDLEPALLIVESGTCPVALETAKKSSIAILELEFSSAAPAGTFSVGETQHVVRHHDQFAQPGDCALLLHTSGTTGRPKLVELTQKQLITSAMNIAATLQLTAADRCLNVMPLFHIHGLVSALLATLAAGGRVVCAPNFDPDKFLFWLKDHQPSWYTAVPTIHQAVLASVKEDPGAIDRHSLRFIRSCSASLPETVARELEQFFRVPVLEAYGMTEAAHQIASNPLPPKRRKVGSVGLPTGTEVAVIAEDGFIRVGEIGEIVIRGETVIEEYANGNVSEDSSFINGWFRTGDYGFIDEDGYVFLRGRLKEMINRGGEKISPLEVEKALLSHSEVAQAAVFALPHPSLGEDVAAAVILRSGSRLLEKAIRDHLLCRIAAFKVPAQIFFVDELPKTATGKLNRGKLSERFGLSQAGGSGDPLNRIELAVFEIYREVLGIEFLGREDNFFALGGDSIRATQVINRVRALLGVNLTIATIFHLSSVADLAAEISARMGEAKTDTRISVGKL
jgi:acyl-CoA synthetase (AMP-forming)/AMP-acid ligase II/acyl carrier protein